MLLLDKGDPDNTCLQMQSQRMIFFVAVAKVEAIG